MVQELKQCVLPIRQRPGKTNSCPDLLTNEITSVSVRCGALSTATPGHRAETREADAEERHAGWFRHPKAGGRINAGEERHRRKVRRVAVVAPGEKAQHFGRRFRRDVNRYEVPAHDALTRYDHKVRR